MKKLLYTFLILICGLKAFSQDTPPINPKPLTQFFYSVQGGDTIVYAKGPLGWMRLLRYHEGLSYFSRNFKGTGSISSPIDIADTLKLIGAGQLQSTLIAGYLNIRNGDASMYAGLNGNILGFYNHGDTTSKALEFNVQPGLTIVKGNDWKMLNVHPGTADSVLGRSATTGHLVWVAPGGIIDSTIYRTVANSYSLSALQTKLNNYVPTSRTITINGTTLDLSANRAWTVSSGLATTNFIKNETPSGAINGTNVTFTLANTPTSGTVELYKNGLLLKPTTDYTISGSTITCVVAPISGSNPDKLLAHYLK